MTTKPDLAERDARFDRLRTAMEQEGLDALVVAGKGHWWTGRGYFRYLTDFHLWGHDGLILVPLEGDPMLTLTSAAVAQMIGDRGWITDVQGDPDIAPKVVRAIKEKGLEDARIGIAGRRFIMSVGTYEILVDGLPDVEFVKADCVIDRVRMLKSPLEIRQNRELWDLTKASMERFVEVLKPGKTQLELSAEAIKVAKAGGAGDILVIFDGAPPSDKPVTLDGIVSYHMEIEGPSGHWCEAEVTLAFREIAELEHRLMESELRALDEICRAAKPGVELGRLGSVFEQVLTEYGWELSDEQPVRYDFHGQGMDVIEFPVEGLLASDEVQLREGMVFSYHPRRNLVADVRGTGISDDIVIKSDGAERLSGDWNLRWRPMG